MQKPSYWLIIIALLLWPLWPLWPLDTAATKSAQVLNKPVCIYVCTSDISQAYTLCSPHTTERSRFKCKVMRNCLLVNCKQAFRGHLSIAMRYTYILHYLCVCVCVCSGIYFRHKYRHLADHLKCLACCALRQKAIWLAAGGVRSSSVHTLGQFVGAKYSR